ncbi:MAG: HAD family hydrolase [Dehalococcoidia bacterium]|nr:HAD family hydrolase [Dehalococcoidia bacterium]
MAKNTLSFDLTGTLATFSFCDAVWFQGIPRLYAAKNGMGFDEAKEYLLRAYDEVGDHAVEWYDIKYWFSRFDLGTGWTELIEEFIPNIEFYPETHAILERFSQTHELVLITNAAREFMEIETASIQKYFSRIISSVSDFGEVKKTPEFYARVCQSVGEDPSGWIHVGDHWQFDYMAPRGAGITTFYLDRQKEQAGDFIIHSLSELESKLL